MAEVPADASLDTASDKHNSMISDNTPLNEPEVLQPSDFLGENYTVYYVSNGHCSCRSP